jgi:hypothetical protein
MAISRARLRLLCERIVVSVSALEKICTLSGTWFGEQAKEQADSDKRRNGRRAVAGPKVADARRPRRGFFEAPVAAAPGSAHPKFRGSARHVYDRVLRRAAAVLEDVLDAAAAHAQGPVSGAAGRLARCVRRKARSSCQS